MKERKIWLSLVTPFDEARNVDWEAAIEYVRLLDRYDFAGFLVGGSVGEGLLLSDDEVRRYIDVVRKVSNKPIMLGVIDFNFQRAATRLALDADFNLVTPCIYFKPPKEATKEYFRQISNTSKSKVYLYNNAGRVGVNLDRSIYRFAYDELENVIGVKECDDAKFAEYSSEFTRWDFMTGNDPFMISKDFVNAGGSGCISTLANIAPKLSLDLAADPFDDTKAASWEAYVRMLIRFRIR